MEITVLEKVLYFAGKAIIAFAVIVCIAMIYLGVPGKNDKGKQ